MSGKKGMQGSGGRRPGAGKPPTRHIARKDSRYTIGEQPESLEITQAGDYIHAAKVWTVTHADAGGITLTSDAGDVLTLHAAA